MVKQMKNHYLQIEKKDRRTSRGMVVAMSSEITEIDDRGTYKVQSETNVDRYYIVKFMDGTPVYCSCLDFTNRSMRDPNLVCKHMRAIVFAENYGLIREKQVCSVDVLPYTKEQYSF